MDFLDPKRKKAHRRRLFIGYILMAIAVAMGTLILLFTAYGFDIDRKTGDIIQNGTVFVDSQPGGSTIILNDEVQGNRTAARLALPGGRQYTIRLESEGYRPWSRTFSLDGGSIERLVYPLLIPTELTTSDVQLYASSPALASQSPDRRRLLVQQPGQTYVFDFYDLNNPGASPAVLTVPSTILTEPTKPATITVLEWSNNNRHVLLDRVVEGRHEFLVFDTETPASSINLNTTLGVAPTTVRLRDKKFDQFYIYDLTGGILRSADSRARSVSAPILRNVIDFKSYGEDLLLYVTKEGATEGRVNFRIREKSDATYLLKSVPDATTYLLDISEYDGTPYYIVGGDRSDAVFIYRDPLPTLKSNGSNPVLVHTVLRLESPRFASFSANSGFIVAQAGPELVVFDIEGDRQFRTTLNYQIPQTVELEWMDGHRFTFVDQGKSYMIDFDGSNEQQLVSAANLNIGPYFAPDFQTVFAVSPSAQVTGRFALTQTSLIR